jgi:hypothetical protein
MCTLLHCSYTLTHCPYTLTLLIIVFRLGCSAHMLLQSRPRSSLASFFCMSPRNCRTVGHHGCRGHIQHTSSCIFGPGTGGTRTWTGFIPCHQGGIRTSFTTASSNFGREERGEGGGGRVGGGLVCSPAPAHSRLAILPGKRV